MACEPGILEARWVATLCVYWEAAPLDRRRHVRRSIEQALAQSSPERTIHDLQQALRLLGLTELQIIRLVLIRCLDLAENGQECPVSQVADELHETIQSLETRRRNGRRRS